MFCKCLRGLEKSPSDDNRNSKVRENVEQDWGLRLPVRTFAKDIASVEAGGGAAGLGTSLSQLTSGGRLDKGHNRQLVIDVSCVGEGAVKRVSNREAAKPFSRV